MTAASAAPPPPPPPAPPSKGLDRNRLYLLIALGVVVVVGAAILVVPSGDGDGSATVATSSPSPTATTPSPTPTPTLTSSPSPTVEPSPSPTGPSGPSGGAVALEASCFAARDGYGIGYPAGWFTPAERAWNCQLFDPQPFAVEPDTEPPIVAVSVYVERYPLAELLAAVTDPASYEVLSTEEGTFGDASRPGSVVETVQIEDLFFPAGTRTYAVLVDMLDRTIVVTTNDLAFTDYEENKQIALAMANSLSVAG